MKKPNLQTSLAITLFVATAGAVAALNEPNSTLPIEQPISHTVTAARDIDVVFVIDTTGSMGGLIEAAKEKVWSIANTLASANHQPNIRMGLVAYRDRGDAYVTRVFDLSEDLDAMYSVLMDFQAQGGGDGPESVNQGLSDAIHKLSWSAGTGTYRTVFLVGDAPAPRDYPNEVQYPTLVRQAAAKGIVVNAIRCGNDQTTASQWQQIASIGQGAFFTVGQDGSALAFSTPYDQRLATASAELDSTRLTYGDAQIKLKAEQKRAATNKLHEQASVASRARRAEFNTTGSGKRNQFGAQDLVADISAGKIALADVAPEALPEPLLNLAPAEREQLVKDTALRRDRLKQEIADLAEQRSSYLKDKAAAAPEAESSLDYQLFDAIKQQTKELGMEYSGAPKL